MEISQFWGLFSITNNRILIFSYRQSFQCHDVFFLLQYIYETNENGDKVVLGKGTYGVVYAGRDLSNQVRIAIKEIPEKDSTYVEIFCMIAVVDVFVFSSQSGNFSRKCGFPCKPYWDKIVQLLIPRAFCL